MLYGGNYSLIFPVLYALQKFSGQMKLQTSSQEFCALRKVHGAYSASLSSALSEYSSMLFVLVRLSLKLMWKYALKLKRKKYILNSPKHCILLLN